PQDASQTGRKSQADLAGHLNLADSGLLVFNWVLYGDDLERLFLDLVEGAVKGGRFAGTRRPGHQEDAVRPVDQLAEGSVMVRKHANVGEVENHPALVEQAHDDAFAVDHRDDRHAYVDLAVVHAHLDPAVLGQSFLGDVEPGHDLDAANDGGLKTVDL